MMVIALEVDWTDQLIGWVTQKTFVESLNWPDRYNTTTSIISRGASVAMETANHYYTWTNNEDCTLVLRLVNT